jgi:hypothetical protein
MVNGGWPVIHGQGHEIIFNAGKFLKPQTESETGDKQVEERVSNPVVYCSAL